MVASKTTLESEGPRPQERISGGQGVQGSIHQLARRVSNMPIHQTERTGEFGVVLWSLHYFTFISGLCYSFP